MLNTKLEQARKNAEEAIGFTLPDSVADYILAYTIRKFYLITKKEDKPEGYLAILYQNEIKDYCMRKAISFLSENCNRKENAYVS